MPHWRFAKPQRKRASLLGNSARCLMDRECGTGQVGFDLKSVLPVSGTCFRGT